MVGELYATMVAVQTNKHRIAQMPIDTKRPLLSDSQLEAIVVAAYIQEVRR
jgi:hypothetical protein